MNTNMTTPVDVLALLDRLIEEKSPMTISTHEGGSLRMTVRRDAALVEARAAVAELMDAANAGTVTSAEGFDRPAMYFNPSQTERLRAALARCGK